MTNLDKVSQAVKDEVAAAKAMGGKSKKQIDTLEECNRLCNYLAQNGDNMNIHEKSYIQEHINNYKKDYEVTPDTRDTVKNIAKRTYDRKKIDSDTEAIELAMLLKNTKGELKNADIEYIKQVLTDNGYEEYIDMYAGSNYNTGTAVPSFGVGGDVPPKAEEDVEEAGPVPDDTNSVDPNKPAETNNPPQSEPAKDVDTDAKTPKGPRTDAPEQSVPEEDADNYGKGVLKDAVEPDEEITLSEWQKEYGNKTEEQAKKIADIIKEKVIPKSAVKSAKVTALLGKVHEIVLGKNNQTSFISSAILSACAPVLGPATAFTIMSAINAVLRGDD